MTLVLPLRAKGFKVNQQRFHYTVPRRITTYEKDQYIFTCDILLCINDVKEQNQHQSQHNYIYQITILHKRRDNSTTQNKTLRTFYYFIPCCGVVCGLTYFKQGISVESTPTINVNYTLNTRNQHTENKNIYEFSRNHWC